jgi:hypothetical protein
MLEAVECEFPQITGQHDGGRKVLPHASLQERKVSEAWELRRGQVYIGVPDLPQCSSRGTRHPRERAQRTNLCKAAGLQCGL